jgi:hypothetical protein
MWTRHTMTSALPTTTGGSAGSRAPRGRPPQPRALRLARRSPSRVGRGADGGPAGRPPAGDGAASPAPRGMSDGAAAALTTVRHGRSDLTRDVFAPEPDDPVQPAAGTGKAATMAKRRGLRLASRPADKVQKLPAELVALGEAVKLEGRPELSGSASGAFTYALMSGRLLGAGPPRPARPGVAGRQADRGQGLPEGGRAARPFGGDAGGAAARAARGGDGVPPPGRDGPGRPSRGRQANLGQAGRLTRSYAVLLETLDRHRGKGSRRWSGSSGSR